jgi:hypothetical protein
MKPLLKLSWLLLFLSLPSLSWAATVTKTIGTASRDYSTITLWEADLDNGAVYSASDDAVGEVYNDSAFDEDVNINGGGTIGLTSITLTVPSAERHDGTAGSGARIDRTGSGITDLFAIASDMSVTIEWLELDGNSNTIQDMVHISGGLTGPTTLKQMIIHDNKHNWIANGINDAGSASGDNGTQILNNIMYDIGNDRDAGVDAISIFSNTFNGTINVINNTIHNTFNDNGSGNCYGVRIRDSVSTETFQNNIVTDSSGTTSGTIQDYSNASPSNATVSYNMASDTSASGTGSLDSGVSGDIFVSTTGGSEDLHLKSGASVDPIDAGLDKGTTPTGVNFDIDNRDRDVEADTWDMGADEFVAVVTNSVIHTSTFNTSTLN